MATRGSTLDSSGASSGVCFVYLLSPPHDAVALIKALFARMGLVTTTTLISSHLCPLCKQPGRLLDADSNGPVDYYRCDPCWHAWSHHKSAPHTAPVPITGQKRAAFYLRRRPDRRSEAVPMLPYPERRGLGR